MRILTSILFFFIYTKFSIASELINELVLKRDQIKKWQVLGCPPNQKGISEVKGECKQHDVINFSGVSCLSAYLANDLETAKDRCLDVELGQSENGRWWRAMSGLNSKENTFSRDMALGVFSYLYAEYTFGDSFKAKLKAQKWITYMEKNKGLMCPGQQSCRLNFGIAGLGYKVFKKIGAIDSSNENFSIIKKLKLNSLSADLIIFLESLFSKSFSQYQWVRGYEIHLKSIYLTLMRLLSGDTKKLRTIAKNLYLSDKYNPLYSLAHFGAQEVVGKRLLKLCPSFKEIKNNQPVAFFLQRYLEGGQSTYKKSGGYDCIHGINTFLSYYKNKIPRKDLSLSKCKIGFLKIGKINGKIICTKKEKISKVNCERFSGEFSIIDKVNYCTFNRYNFLEAKVIKKTCPEGTVYRGKKDGIEVCEDLGRSQSMRSCMKSWDDGSLNTVDDRENPKSCFEFKQTHWIKTKINRLCAFEKIDLGIYSIWPVPVCRNILHNKVIAKSDCMLLWDGEKMRSYFYEGKYCIAKQRKGYFQALRFKD